jgi:uncharacterized protein (TIGR03086 family)
MGPTEQLDVLVPNFERLLAAAGPALDSATPCEGWVVRDLLGHVNGGARMFTAAYTGELVHERDLGAEPAPVIAEALAGFRAALGRPGALEKILDTPFGAMPGEAFGRLAALDLLIHTWDLSQALGVDPGVPGDVVEAVDGFARQALTDDLRRPGLFGPEIDASPGTGALDALAAFTGRRPR